MLQVRSENAMQVELPNPKRESSAAPLSFFKAIHCLLTCSGFLNSVSKRSQNIQSCFIKVRALGSCPGFVLEKPPAPRIAFLQPQAENWFYFSGVQTDGQPPSRMTGSFSTGKDRLKTSKGKTPQQRTPNLFEVGVQRRQLIVLPAETTPSPSICTTLQKETLFHFVTDQTRK